jgi:hypothetical protein
MCSRPEVTGGGYVLCRNVPPPWQGTSGRATLPLPSVDQPAIRPQMTLVHPATSEPIYLLSEDWIKLVTS